MPKSKRPKKTRSKKRTQYGAPIHLRTPFPLRRVLWLSVIGLVIVAGLTYLYWPQAETAPVTRRLSPGLQITDTVVGAGEEARTGMTASVHYTGWLKDGTKFDSSLDRGTPLQFKIGAGSVIRGWDEGLVGMKVGGKRTLNIPSALGYGPRGQPPAIPPNADLTFEIQLLGLK